MASTSQQPHHPTPHNGTSRERSLHSQVHDAVSVTRDKFADVVSRVQKPETRNGIKDGWDALLKVMFAPCAGGDIGGVPRDEVLGVDDGTPTRASGGSGGMLGVVAGAAAGGSPWRRAAAEANKDENNATPWSSVPFEVSASQPDLQGTSLISSPVESNTLNESAVSQSQQQSIPEQRALTPREQRKAKSRAKLRQLGARHQLASGFPGESLADTARPISPGGGDNEVEQHSDLVDFDDGISAISSHTLEEQERRRLVKERKNVVRLHPLNFSQIIDENTELKYNDMVGSSGLDLVKEEVDEHDTEVVFGEPFYEEEGLFQSVRKVDESNETSNRDVHEITYEQPVPHGKQVHEEIAPASTLTRVTSTRTHQTQNTTVTEDSHEFEEMYKRHEAMYWVDQDQVACAEESALRDRSKRSGARTSQRMSIEERARRLRELSRSRSRSDGTGSTNKSAASSLVSGQHPHDTVPLHTSDLFTRRWKTNSGGNGSSSGSSSRSARRTPPRPYRQQNGLVPGSVMEESDPFASLDYGEI